MIGLRNSRYRGPLQGANSKDRAKTSNKQNAKCKQASNEHFQICVLQMQLRPDLPFNSLKSQLMNNLSLTRYSSYHSLLTRYCYQRPINIAPKSQVPGPTKLPGCSQCPSKSVCSPPSALESSQFNSSPPSIYITTTTIQPPPH